MFHYVILPNPSHNRIYFNSAIKIAKNELLAIAESMQLRLEIIEDKESELPASIYFSTETPLSEAEMQRLGTFSMYYALFEIVQDGLLRPVLVKDFHVFPESMNQILRYSGKTNEQFTRLMVNLAVSACKTSSSKIKLIDPMCGKGTTLYEGLIRGFDVVGIDMNAKWIQETKTFVVKYLQEGKFKYNTRNEKRTANGKKIADLFVLNTAAEKSEYNLGNVQSLEIFTSDARNAKMLIKQNSCDILVSDLPYGVQHASKSDADSKLSRSPLQLLNECCIAWKYIMKSKGAIVLSFNEFTLKYKDAAKVFQDNGFIVLEDEPYNGYLHRVDQAINRNLIVVQKP
ncbi:TRM11 family SAM-dependent methyltransferase [Inconstantimicrobium mannanitabidum]|uniref:DNA methylase n=1 Tax=Inconstantimicrobium mannanitabidum TaxID=1604901 RepID=A0ACB5RHX1_9CLOT|nr:DNA methylase [Clostridium sp. TW13]GKX68690.1 DNA methylase [Clostridium sp. TW13]